MTQLDITLDDCANSKVCARRLRKSASNSLGREVKEAIENTVDDLDETLEDSKQLETIKGKGAKSKTEPIYCGVKYPLDLWFILADYIRPEDVQVFAAICRDAAFVVNTFQFWIRMYQRYYCAGSHLPERLHPEHIKKSPCLRACVVRSLYHMYPPFAKRTTRATLDEEVYNLVPLKCVSVWHSKSNNKWCFFFKFQSAFSCTTTKAPRTTLGSACETWCDSAADYDTLPSRNINRNPEDGCRVLFISCLHYTAVTPTVMGAHLADIKVMLKDARYHVLQLSFASSRYHCSPCHRKSSAKLSGDVVLLDSVEISHVYHWWHPKYPFNRSF